MVGMAHVFSFSIIEKPVFTTDDFPFDFDTTSIGLTVLKREGDAVKSVMDEMLQYCNEDGIFLVSCSVLW